MKLLIVSGLSGSGKTIVLHALEDQGYYCIDNLPLGLLPAFAAQMSSPSQRHYQNAAVGIDVRNLVDDFRHFKAMLDEIRTMGLECEILFLEADSDTLLKRFSETRRRHPLTSKKVPLAEAIQTERKLLNPLAESADWIIDTSRTTIHELRDLIRERVSGADIRLLSLLFLSFGFKHGVPSDADFVFDVRCLPNPHWVPTLRAQTGRDQEVADFLRAQPVVGEMLEDIKQYLERWIPRFEADNRSYMTVAIGCTGGHHRSVFVVEDLAAHFRGQRENVMMRHRELAP